MSSDSIQSSQASSVESTTTLVEKDKIQILIAEYNTLREELIAAGNKMYQILTVGSALLVFLISQYPTPKFWLAVIAAIIIVVVFSVLNIADTRRLALKVRQLEEEINKRAGETLLTWESHHGLYRKRR